MRVLSPGRPAGSGAAAAALGRYLQGTARRLRAGVPVRRGCSGGSVTRVLGGSGRLLQVVSAAANGAPRGVRCDRGSPLLFQRRATVTTPRVVPKARAVAVPLELR